MIKDTKELAKKIVSAIDDKKGRDILALEIKEISIISDYFVIASAGSAVQAKAIADNIEEELAKEGLHARHKEGYNQGSWILLDYSDVVVHIFLEDDRRFYNLEQLWGDAPAI